MNELGHLDERHEAAPEHLFAMMPQSVVSLGGREAKVARDGFTFLMHPCHSRPPPGDEGIEVEQACILHRHATALPHHGGTRKALENKVTGYLEAAINKDWPAVERRRPSPDATHALDDVYATVLTFRAGDGRETALLTQILHQLDLVTESRRARLVKASGVVPGLIRLVLFGGAALTIGFTFFFGTENLRAQTMMTGTLSVLIFSALLTILAIDHPFSGGIKVAPDALLAVLEDFGGASAR